MDVRTKIVKYLEKIEEMGAEVDYDYLVARWRKYKLIEVVDVAIKFTVLNRGFLFTYSLIVTMFDEVIDRDYGAVYFPNEEVDRIEDIVKSIIGCIGNEY